MMNESFNVEQHDFDKPLIHEIDSIIDSFIRDCNNKFFHTFDHICVYYIKPINIGNNEIINLTISGKGMNL